MRTKELTKLSSFFERYKKRLIAPEATVINEFLEVVEDLYGIKVPKEKIKYTPSSKTLTFVGSGALRSEIKIHKKEIMTHLKGRLGEKNAPKIIL